MPDIIASRLAAVWPQPASGGRLQLRSVSRAELAEVRLAALVAVTLALLDLARVLDGPGGHRSLNMSPGVALRSFEIRQRHERHPRNAISTDICHRALYGL